MIGTVVGNYKIVEMIGEGGMGSVFRGIDIMLEREVAIKMLRPEFASQPNVVERFRTEAVTLAKLSHPNIATLHSFFRQRDDFFMVMEFVRGVTLDQLIRNHGAMTLDHALPLFCQGLEGIGYAHRMGIIHRDIKPANMMQTPEGSIKVMDFGIARVLGSGRMTRQGAIVGTIEYMSPEQVRGEEGDARSDVYSLGILLYEMLTGRVPFSSNSEFELMRAQAEAAPIPPRTFVAAIPLEVEQAIMRSLAKRVEARFQTAAEFREVVARALDGNLIARGAISPSVPLISPATPDFSSPVSKEVLKETRLGGELLAPPIPDWRSIGELKETRLGVSAGVHPAATQTMPGRGSLLSNLNWKHYSAGAVVAIAVVATLVGTSIAMFSWGKEKPAAATELPTEATRPAVSPRPAEPLPQELPPQTAIPSDASAQPLSDNAGPRSGGGSPARQRGARSDRQAAAPPPRTNAPQPSVAPRENPPTVSQQAPRPPAGRDQGTTKGGVKEIGKGVKDSAKKVFGGLFGGGGDKEKEKKKKP
jgi:serine/threonine-protein kinase